MNAPPVTVDVVLVENFPMLALSLVIEPLRVTNREAVRPFFEWRLLSPDGMAVRSSSGFPVPVAGELDETQADVALLLASYHPERTVSRKLEAWLRRRARQGTLMGCVDTGAMTFARAGLLERYPAAAHQEALPGFREAFGEHRFTESWFVLSGDRCSSAGGAATLDMTLALIARFTSDRHAARVAEILNYRKGTGDRQSIEQGFRQAWPGLTRSVGRAVELMLANLERPISVSQIALRVGVPEWRLRRLFLRDLGVPPKRHYLALRLDRARNLLRNSRETVGTIALLTGFDSGESFARAYHRVHGCNPSRDREQRAG